MIIIQILSSSCPVIFILCALHSVFLEFCRALSEWPLADRYNDSSAILHSLLHLTRSCWSSTFLNEEESIIESNANENRYPGEAKILKYEELMRMGIVEQKIEEQKIKKKSEMKINRRLHIVLHWHCVTISFSHWTHFISRFFPLFRNYLFFWIYQISVSISVQVEKLD